MSTGPDSVVVVPTISTGVNIDNTAVTQPGGTAANRQRVDIPGQVLIGSDILTAILVEMRVNNALLAIAFGINDNLDSLRNDLTTYAET